MEVEFTRKTDKDFRRHRDYLRRIGKSDGHKYQKYELDSISKSLKTNISKGLKNSKKNITTQSFPKSSNIILVVIRCMLIKRVII